MDLVQYTLFEFGLLHFFENDSSHGREEPTYVPGLSGSGAHG